MIKSCFKAPLGYIFIGLDFNALEARIDALTTKDPAKLAVYIDGYDSHSYNTYGYWPNKMPDIRTTDPSKKLRTFLLTISGKEHTFLEGDEVMTKDGVKKIEEIFDAKNVP